VFWWAVCGGVPVAGARSTRVYVSASGTVEVEELLDTGEAVSLPSTSGSEWARADVRVRPFREVGSLSDIRLVNSGGADIPALVAGTVARWHVDLDAAAGALIESASVAASAGSFNADHVASAVGALLGQWIGELPVDAGVDRPVLVCGRNRAGLRRYAPSSIDDRQALVERVIVSGNVDADLAAVVSRQFRPSVIGGRSAPLPLPEVLFGPGARPEVAESGLNVGGLRELPPRPAAGHDVPGGMSGALRMAVVADRSEPALLLSGGAGSALGVVRLTA
ncbi:MAG: hypothetical protein OXG35_00550, partial [Acidobacteria bacterium]|nr:hypothetical protein [Acidobacteriota bacterium]